MTPTVTIPLADYLMLKEDVKKLQTAITDNSKVLRITKGMIGNRYYEEFHIINADEAVKGLQQSFFEQENEFNQRKIELRKRVSDLEDKNRSLEIDYQNYKSWYLSSKEKKPWWRKIL
jgi:hypothetical protein